ncbi:cupin domain-containing protein [Chromobacterium vaccinii]|uniref:Cupin domain-containing protein n=1 Tax=Chromobacterium vaccinii TaxID=1108595 RepID=A0ABV0F6P1_9NEIS
MEVKEHSEVRFLSAGKGESTWLNGDLYTVKVSGEQSAGSISVLEAIVPPGGGPPLHNHLYEDEAFYILEGELDIYVENLAYTARLGDFVFIPRGKFHRFRNNTNRPAKQLLVFTPGGFDRFFIESGKAPVEGEPIPAFDPKDNDKARVIAEKYGSIQAMNALGA